MKKDKNTYEAPALDVVELKIEGVIAASGLQAPNFDDGGDLFAL